MSSRPDRRVTVRPVGSPTGSRCEPATLPPAVLWGIVLLALAVRLLYILSVRSAVFFTYLQTEAARYHEWATLILQSTPPTPPYDEPPGYGYFVAAVYRVFGAQVLPVALVQALLGAVSCGLIAGIAAHWFATRAGALAGLIAALYGPLIYYTGKLEPPIVFICVVLLAMRTMLPRRPRTPRWTIVGALWALAMVFRVEAAFALPVVALDVGRRGGREALLRVAAPLVVLVALAVTINLRVGHQFAVFTSAPGLMLWLGNDADADGVNPFLSPSRERIAQDIGVRAPDAAAADVMFMRRVLRFWFGQPRQATALLWKKFLWTWNDRELSNTGDPDWETAQSWFFRRPLFPPGLGIMLPLALAGGLLLGSGWCDVPLLAAPLAVALAAPVVFFTNGRLRLIGATSLAILAALALRRLPALLREPRAHGRLLARAALGIAAGSYLGWSDPFGIRSYEIAELTVNRAILERAAGEVEPAVRDLRRALALNPNDTVAWLHLGLAEEQRGEDLAALGAYLDGLARVPAERPTVAYMDALSEAPADRALQAAAARFLRRRGSDARLLPAFVEASDEGRRALCADMLRSIARY